MAALIGGALLLLISSSFLGAEDVLAEEYMKNEGRLSHLWNKREADNIQCEKSKLIVNIRKKATYVNIVTDNGNVLFSVNSKNTIHSDLFKIFQYTSKYYYVRSKRQLRRNLQGNNSTFFISHEPRDGGIEVAVQNWENNTVFNKKISQNEIVPKEFGVKCVNLTGVEVRLESDVDVNRRDGYNKTALLWATFYDDERLVKELLEKGADPNGRDDEDTTPLLLAVAVGDCGTAELLVKHGATVNDISGPLRWTALHLAAIWGRLDCARFLLNNGAKVSNGNLDDDGTPLHLAALGGFTDLVKELVRKGADVNSTTRGGYTALHLAVEKGPLELVRYLIEAGTDVNKRNEDGSTPLILAVTDNDYEGNALPIVKLLVELANADVNVKNKFGSTALSKAEESGLNKVVQYLKAHGAV